MLNETKTEGFETKTKPSKESLEWNKLTTIVATIVVLLLFTRSAPFPATTYWELTIARDYIDTNVLGIILPETLTLKIADSSLSLLGLKAIYHILYFILCSFLCVWIFKNKEPLPGLIGLSVFAFTMQSFLNLRMLITLNFILGLLFLLDKNLLRNRFGLILIPIFAAASGLGLNSLIILSLIFCHAFCNPKYKLSLIVCALIGGLFFPEGFISALDTDSLLNWNFMPKSEMEILYVLSGIFLLFNLISLVRTIPQDIPYLIYYALTGFFALIWPSTTPVFVMMGLFVLIRLYSDLKPLSLNYQMIGLLTITAMVYLYLFVNPFGIKLNPNIKKQLNTELYPIMEGYKDNIPIEKFNIGELLWKGFIHYDQEKIRSMYQSNLELFLYRRGIDDYTITMENNNSHNHREQQEEIEF